MSDLSTTTFSELLESDETWGLGTMKNSAGVHQWNPHNLLKSSEDFSSSDWTKTNTTVTNNAAMAPDGTLTADKITTTSTGASFYQSVSTTSGVPYRGGFVVRYVDHQWFRLQMDGSSQRAWFDIQNGVVGTDNTSGAEIVDLGGGWYYLIAEDTGDTSFLMSLVPVSADDTTTAVSGASAYIWGAHLYRNDQGGMATVPTSDRALAALEYYVPNKAVVTGSNLVTNGTFDADSGWTKGTNATISGGVLDYSGGSGNTDTTQECTMVADRHYVVKWDIVSASAGSMKIREGSTSGGTGVSAVGSYAYYLTAEGTGRDVVIDVASTFVGSIDNITVEEVDRNPSAARYLPRRENHEYIDGAWVKGLLVEPDGATNVCLSSGDISDATNWTKVNSATLSQDAVGLDGQVSAVTLTDDGSTGSSPVRVRQDITVSTSTQYTYWVVAKQDQLNWIRLLVENFTTPANSDAWFDIANGVEGTIDAGFDDSGIKEVADGWYLCWVVFTTDASDTSGRISILMADGDGDTSVDLDGTSSVIIDSSQVEAGLVPTSYIPTSSGAAVSRGAETTTIPASVMDTLGLFDTVAVDGTELVTNGTFDADTDWTKGTGWTIGSGVASKSAGTSSYLAQSEPLVAGRTYRVTFTVSGRSAGSAGPRFTGGSLTTGTLRSADGTYTENLVAQTGNANITIYGNSTFVGDIDNISVKEVHRRGIGVQMHGYMSYGDRDSSATISFWRLKVSGDDQILSRLDTRGADTGQLEALQYVGGENEKVSGSGTQYSPDVNVPFKIAVRHLDNAIQGAADGTATTENSDPTGLADLTGYPMEVAYNGPALHITKFNIFRENTPDCTDTFRMTEDFVVEATR